MVKYKYQKNQIFGKRLKVPKDVLERVYHNNLSFEDMMQYELEDKIPITCLTERDRKIVEKFGIEKAKTLDWELIIRLQYTNAREVLMSIDPSLEDVNARLYELVQNQIRLSDYSPKMKEFYQDRFFEISSDEKNAELKFKKENFNDGRVSLKELILDWDLYKDKDLSYCLEKDFHNSLHITDHQVKDFMEQFAHISNMIMDTTDIYQFICDIHNISNDLEREQYIRKVTDSILQNNVRMGRAQPLSNDQYRELFQYSSMEEYLLQIKEPSYADDIIEIFKQIRELPKDYVFHMPIPLQIFFHDTRLLMTIKNCGLKNIVDLDNECGNFFSNNDCAMLRPLTDAIGDSNPQTKEELYHCIREVITNIYSVENKFLDYRNIMGPFRVNNPDLFLEQAPEELENAFYTSSITPHLLANHPEYISYLKGKNLNACFSPRLISVNGQSRSFYDFLLEKSDFETAIHWMIEYRDILDIAFYRDYSAISFTQEDQLGDITKRLCDAFRRNLITYDMAYPENIPKDMILNNPDLFLSKDAPADLKEAFYHRTLDVDVILSNSLYLNYLQNIDLSLLYPFMQVTCINEDNQMTRINLIDVLKKSLDEKDSLVTKLLYGKYLKAAYEAKELNQLIFNLNISQEDLLNEIDAIIKNAITTGKIKYDENMPNHFKSGNPSLFLNDHVPDDIRQKFYTKQMSLQDFLDNPNLLELFGNTNVVLGFPQNVAWMYSLFSNANQVKEANSKRLNAIDAYLKIQDVSLQHAFQEYVTEHSDEISSEKIDFVAGILLRLSQSNSSEIFTFREELATQILQAPNPMECLNQIEDKFIKNNIPTVGKIYSCFDILHPDFRGFDFSDMSMVSPVLKNASMTGKKMIVFADLIKASFGSNNRSINSYLRNIEIGSNLYEKLKSGEILYESLNTSDREELRTFQKHLETLYYNTLKGKKEMDTFVSTGNSFTDIMELAKKLSSDGTLDYSLGDRIVRMFCGLVGINTLEQAKRYIKQTVENANIRNQNAANQDMTLEVGDFVKGIGGITYLRNILQNGSVSKEYLGSSAGSDATPLDTDISMITKSDGIVKDKISDTAAGNYGPIWFVLKNDNRFITTRTKTETPKVKNNLSKLEVFYTGVLGPGHYGIRTGFASSDINYIVMENYDPRVGLEIATNGFYIPIANMEGKIIFTPDDYHKLREKMSGLSYYGISDYTFSDHLVNQETEFLASQMEKSISDVQRKRERINEIIQTSVEELGLHLKTSIDGDLTDGFVELIDTGSTGRGTNKPGDGDFDFMMRLDKTLLLDSSKIEELKQNLLKHLGKEHSHEFTGDGDFRLKGVELDNNMKVDIDISFVEKTDKVSYSTEMSLQDRLSTIQKSDPDKYKYVLANILLAKQVLKNAEVYKPNRGDTPQGGLGGVGVENWILQNGGSFIDAAKKFVEEAQDKNFDEFKEQYQIWDFGDNHFAEKRGQYPHDNFIENNMSEKGYKKMVQILKEYVENYTYEKAESITK